MLRYFLNRVDFFYAVPNLKIDKKKHETTEVGGILSLLLISIVSYSIYFTGNDVIYKLNPKLVTKQTTLPQGGSMTLDPEEFFFGFQFEDESSNSVDDQEKLIYFKVFHSKYSKNLENGVLGTSFIETVTELATQTCLGINNNHNMLFSESQLLNFNCLQDNQLSLGGEWTSNEVNILRIELHFCGNSTENNYSCVRKEDQATLINGNYIGIYTNSYLVDHKNFKSPLEIIPHYSYYLVSSEIYKEVELFFKTLEIQTDSGWLFEDISSIKSFAVSKITLDTSIRSQNDDMIASVWVYMSSDLDYSQREYVKLLTIAANTGGIAKFIYIIISWAIKPVSCRIINLKIMNQIFDFHSKKLNSTSEVNIESLIKTMSKRTSSSSKQIKPGKKQALNRESTLIDLQHQPSTGKIIIKPDNYLNKVCQSKASNFSNSTNLLLIDEVCSLEFSWLQSFVSSRLPGCLLTKKLSKKNNLYQKALRGVNAELSVELITKKLIEFDYLKHCLLRKEQLDCFNLILTQNIELFSSQEIFKTQPSREERIMKCIEYYTQIGSVKDSLDFRLLELVDPQLKRILQNLCTQV